MNKSVIVFSSQCYLGKWNANWSYRWSKKEKTEREREKAANGFYKSNKPRFYTHFWRYISCDVLRFWCVVAFVFFSAFVCVLFHKRSSEFSALTPASNHFYPVFITVINKTKTEQANVKEMWPEREGEKRRERERKGERTHSWEHIMMWIRAIYVSFWWFFSS